ncbi:MAG: 50S ribosomal protein L29 [Armatimonadetes bacterium]|nr:50S ribosomal protein L29 [Armatimonadota bacterium]NIM23755.1 50S ribosomal protein L29 [Armatimonadota bacterium]NIM67632.1 50S ribosomal protein L29 [Armatimonadota bacterium]NIN06853.1 50S ribosomal protein L29 [Armatimonadota bacterium]NIO97181.1 50S ribosomal protein L29 [Armatimonadota bacterium]
MKLAQYRKQIRQSSTAELQRMLEEERKNLFISRRDSATKQLENPRKIRDIRKNIARILTVLRERELETAEAGS